MVVLGPSGSRKTVAGMDLCEKHPKGVLYMEIMEPEVFHYDLATCMGMRLQPTNIEDLILGYISAEYRHHHQLPEKLVQGVNTIMGILKEAAQKFKDKHGMMPTIFIDGIDLLAAHDEKVFLRLLSYAK